MFRLKSEKIGYNRIWVGSLVRKGAKTIGYLLWMAPNGKKCDKKQQEKMIYLLRRQDIFHARRAQLLRVPFF